MDAALNALNAAGIKGPEKKKVDHDRKMFELQSNLRNNSTDVQNFLEDLNAWTKEVGEKDKDKNLRSQNKGVSTNILKWNFLEIPNKFD